MGVETEKYFGRKNRARAGCLGVLGIFILICVFVAVVQALFQ